MTLRKSNVIRKQYAEDIITVPTTIGNPPAGSVFTGTTTTSQRWTKDENGFITYSSSGLTYIKDISTQAIVPEADWLDSLVRWTGTENGLLTLEAASDPDFEEGWRMTIYNNTPNFSIEVDTGGTDILRSHNNNLFIPAYSYATIGLMNLNGTTEWYSSIEQTLSFGLGQVADSGTPAAITAAANTWYEIVFTTPDYGTLKNIIAGTVNGRLQIDYANNGTNGVFASVEGHSSIELAETNQILDFSIGINSVISPDADYVKQTAATAGASQATGLYFPFGFSYDGVLNNGDELSLFVRSDTATTINILAVNLSLKTDAMIGVNVTEL